MAQDRATHEQIIARISSVQAELTEFKTDSKQHRAELQERLRAIESTLAHLKGGWKVLALLGAVLAAALAAIASIIAIMKGVK